MGANENSRGGDVPRPGSLPLGIALLIGAALLAWSLARADAVSVAQTTEAQPRVGDGTGGFKAERVATFQDPVYVHGPKGARGLVFVVEQDGLIKVIRKGKKLGGAFLDIRDRVRSGGEEGLLSVAFSPGYKKNRRFYVFFNDQGGDITVQEFKRSRKKARKANPRSARTVIRIGHPDHSNHNGGQLQFGPDRKLYISTGDGGSGGDPPENAQNPDSLLGKILRIDPRPSKGGRGYTVPSDNPFVGRPGADAVFSLGLRNPYRFSFDRRSGNITIGDVGQGAREEIDVERLKVARGANFGWDAFEGSIRFDSSDASPPPAQHELPIFDYAHGSGDCAITGGYVVRDRKIPSLFGRYIYADFCKGDIRSLVPRLDGAIGDRSTGLAAQSGLSSFGEDSRGRIWFTNLFDGGVYRIR